MSDTSSEPGKYVAEFLDGPMEGTIEHRYLENGAPQSRITQYALVNGNEGMFEYVAGESRELNGEPYVTYTLDAKDSDELAGDADPGDYSRHI
jgi:hypothetical protein